MSFFLYMEMSEKMAKKVKNVILLIHWMDEMQKNYIEIESEMYRKYDILSDCYK